MLFVTTQSFFRGYRVKGFPATKVWILIAEALWTWGSLYGFLAPDFATFAIAVTGQAITGVWVFLHSPATEETEQEIQKSIAREGDEEARGILTKIFGSKIVNGIVREVLGMAWKFTLFFAAWYIEKVME